MHPWTNAFVLLEIKVTNARQLLTTESNPSLSRGRNIRLKALLLIQVTGWQHKW